MVTYTGTGANRTIAHNLGSVPGSIIVKRTDTTAAWAVYHRSLANTQYLVLNTTAAAATGATWWNSTTPTSSVFSVGTDASVNASGGTYVAYVFAHDAGGFGAAGTDNVVSCGTFSRTFGNANSVNLGYEPQWVLIKCTTQTDSWQLYDTMRGLSQTASLSLTPNTANPDADTAGMIPTATGFDITATGVGGGTFIYIAIRRGPMKTPTVGTEVFNAIARTGTGSIATVAVGFAPDFLTTFYRSDPGQDKVVFDRLRGPTQYLNTAATTAEINVSTNGLVSFNNTSFTTNANGYANNSGSAFINHVFRRASGFFDVVAYTSDGNNSKTISHNLGVKPELMIFKGRSNLSSWWIYNETLNATKYLILSTAAVNTSPDAWNNTEPTSTQLTLGYNLNGTASLTWIGYLFASCPGVSKVGTYTGTGTTKQIDCGFTAGARFVLIKRTDSTGDWYVWDTARGIISGNDPYLLLNTTAAEVTGTDYIDPLSSGFEISSTAPAAINANGGTYIFLAIA